MDLKGVEPSSLILSWYYQQVVLCESRRFRPFNQMVLSLQHTPYNIINMNMISKNNCYYLWIFFFKNNNYFFERNVGIEPTPRTGMFVFYLLNLFREIVPPVGLEPTQPSLAKGFSYHYSFHYQKPTRTSLLIRSFWSNSRLYLMTPTLLNCCLWSGLSLNHIEISRTLV